MSLRKYKLGNLGKKLELKSKLLDEVQRIDDAIDEVIGDKKVKVKRHSLKGSKNPRKGK